MIEFTQLTSIDYDVFTRLFKESERGFNTGTITWDSPHKTDEQKLALLWDSFQSCLLRADGFVWQLSKDGVPCLLNAGYRIRSTLMWNLTLAGPDAEGSRSWMYSTETTQKEDEFLASNGFTRQYGRAAAGGGTSQFAIRKAKAGLYARPVWIRDGEVDTFGNTLRLFIIGDLLPGEKGFTQVIPTGQTEVTDAPN